MKIIAWNLNHRTKVKKIPLSVITFLSDLAPDVVVFNEFVDSPLRSQFHADVRDIGYVHSAISKSYPDQNQVLILSRHPLAAGDIQPPRTTEAAESNFLHVKLPQHGIELVGLRAPAYKTKKEKESYWGEVATIATRNANRNILFLGDFNYDPFVGISTDIRDIPFSLSSTYSMPNPEGSWSFISSDGTRSSRIDHAIVSASMSVSDVRYLSQWNEIQLAGPKSTSPITDHAVLSLVAQINA